jgi:gluconate 2-dehydrogenase gamma chain
MNAATPQARAINRREALQQLILLVGAGVAAPALLRGNSAHAAQQPQRRFFSPSQALLVTEVAEIMIPRTATPGAKDVGVPEFIDVVLLNVYAPVDRERYLEGLRAFDVLAVQAYGKPFVRLKADQRAALVQSVHDAAVAEELKQKALRAPLNRPFILITKELAMLGFFSSEIGATQVLQYVAIPGSYHGCLPLSQAGNGKSWAHETSNSF